MEKGRRAVLGLAFAAVVGIFGIRAYEDKPLELPIKINQTPFLNFIPR
jgi:hypothetical protein